MAASTTEQRSVGAFSAVDVTGPYRVVVRTQGQQTLGLAGEAKDLAEIETFVNGNTLVVRPKRHGRDKWFRFDKGDRAVITITSGAINKVRSGAIGMTTVDQIAGERFELIGDGPGDIKASGAVRSLVAASRGPGDLALHQLQAASVDLSSDGPGDVTLGPIGAGELTVNLHGPGDVTAATVAGAKVTARLRGPGDLRIAGTSRELRMELDGPGDFHGCDLSTQAAIVQMRGPGDACVNGAIRQFEAESHGPGDLKVSGLQAPKAKVQIHGPGNVELKGSIDSVQAHLSGPGRLEGRGLTAVNADVSVSGPGSAQFNLKQANGSIRLATFDRH
jgi:hypothetical protein